VKGLSPKFPLYIDNIIGAYAANLTLEEVAKQNFKNLLLTTPGERVMDINFGVGLRSYFFEQMTETTFAKISENIVSQVNQYMPFLEINDISFVPGSGIEGEDNLLSVTIDYSIPPRGNLEQLTIGSSANTL
jgi:phage baseplate assembly protein W